MLSVLSVIGGTCYFFFANLDKSRSDTGAIVEMLFSESKLKYDEELESMGSVLKDAGDGRVEMLYQVNKNLDGVLYELATYYVDNGTSINNKDIANKFNSLDSERNSLSLMMAEYNLKKDNSDLFNIKVGANDFYLKSCSYLVRYAELIRNISNGLNGIDKVSDFKFNLFDVYTNIVIKTFNSTLIDGNIVRVEYADSLVESHKILGLKTGEFSINVQHFNRHYSKCDKQKFATYFAANMNEVRGLSDDDCKNAVYYIKVMLDII